MRSSSMARAAMCSPRPSRFSSHRNDLSPRTPRNPNMANNYVETAFNVPVTPEEASLLEECSLVAEKLSGDFEGTPSGEMAALASLYAACSDAFRKIFPKQDHEEDPFASFLDLWHYPAIPSFDADITIADTSED